MKPPTSLTFYYAIAERKQAEKTYETKFSKCNTFQVISDLLHAFLNF